ncbi:antibiotic biosynthesis monooxygenase [Leifsonia sp. ZF2019]|uniref:putative quinol monooxygenase n=1 Tax=Leifsonia sp. ZF2019 TaxID=2781978 RepID=UPI001CBF959B|nr:putative quinol monooxygenase [Leifsonia sp. ZF2019]UAJ81205.1 antibiotic biosynthesis monooxygenase [Leifsonia sp. ZF2019]
MAPDEPIRVIIRLTADREHIEDAARLLDSIVEPSRANPDCLEFRVFRDAGDPAVFTLYEHWTSFAANRVHAGMDYMAEFVATSDEIFTSEATFVHEINAIA